MQQDTITHASILYCGLFHQQGGKKAFEKDSADRIDLSLVELGDVVSVDDGQRTYQIVDGEDIRYVNIQRVPIIERGVVVIYGNRLTVTPTENFVQGNFQRTLKRQSYVQVSNNDSLAFHYRSFHTEFLGAMRSIPEVSQGLERLLGPEFKKIVIREQIRSIMLS